MELNLDGAGNKTKPSIFSILNLGGQKAPQSTTARLKNEKVEPQIQATDTNGAMNI